MIQPAFTFDRTGLHEGIGVDPHPDHEAVVRLGSGEDSCYIPLSEQLPPLFSADRSKLLEGCLSPIVSIEEDSPTRYVITSAEGLVASSIKLVRFNARVSGGRERHVHLETTRDENPRRDIGVRSRVYTIGDDDISVFANHDVLHELHPAEVLFVQRHPATPIGSQGDRPQALINSGGRLRVLPTKDYLRIMHQARHARMTLARLEKGKEDRSLYDEADLKRAVQVALRFRNPHFKPPHD